MQYRTLGSTGTLVSHLCLGTMTFGDETPEADAHGLLDDYVAAGGNFIDTADVYSRGASETIIGRWLAARGNRDDLVIATKARFPMGDGPNEVGLGSVHLRQAVDASLTRLQTDHVDLFQTHAWDPLTPVEETLQTLDDLVTAGKIRYVGVSNVTGWQLQRLIQVARFNGWAPIVTLQPQYNLLAREIEFELLPLCQDEGIGVLPWSPLGGGWLTGKYSRTEAPTGATRLGEDPQRGVEAYDKRNNEATWQVVDTLRQIADARGGEVSPAQIALNWVAAQPTTTAVILGVRHAGQLEDNLKAAAWELDPLELRRLTEVSAPAIPEYPYGLLDQITRERLAPLSEG